MGYQRVEYTGEEEGLWGFEMTHQRKLLKLKTDDLVVEEEKQPPQVVLFTILAPYYTQAHKVIE